MAMFLISFIVTQLNITRLFFLGAANIVGFYGKTPQNDFYFDNLYDGGYFQPIVTNIGLCYGLNNKNVTEVFKQSDYLDTFVDTLYNDVVHQPLKKAISGKLEACGTINT